MFPKRATISLMIIAAALSACDRETPLASYDEAPQFGKPTGPSDPTSEWIVPNVSDGFAFSNEGVSASYKERVCGVHSKIFATTAASNSGDAILHTNNTSYRDRKCPNYPRQIVLTYPDGATETSGVFANLGNIQNTTTSIPVGTSALKGLNIAAGARCGTLRFREVGRNGEYFGGNEVNVTRVDARTWDVESVEPHGAYCDNTGAVLRMPVKFRIVASRDLP